MKLVPLGSQIVVRRLEAAEKTAGGIVLPDSAREKPQQGKVLAVGDGIPTKGGKRVPHQVSEGDRVLFNRYAGTQVQIEGDELLILSESDVLAVFD